MIFFKAEIKYMIIMKRYILLILTGICIIGGTGVPSVFAAEQNFVQDSVSPLDYKKIDADLSDIEKKIQKNDVSIKETSPYVTQLTELSDRITLDKQIYEEELADIQKNIETLGAVPEDGIKESKDVAKQRQIFSNDASRVKAKITAADLTLNKITALNKQILKIRNNVLMNALLNKQSSIFHPKEFWVSLTSFAAFLKDIIQTPVKWYQELDLEGKQTVRDNIAYAVLAMIGAFLISLFFRFFLARRFGYTAQIEHPGYNQKVGMALWMLLINGIIPAAILGVFLIWQEQTTILNVGSFAILLKSVAWYLLAVLIATAGVFAVFTPNNPKWRLIEIGDYKARSLYSALIYSIIAISICTFFQDMANRLSADNQIIYALKILSNAVKAFCIIWLAKRSLYEDTPVTNDELQNPDELQGLSTSSKISLLVMGVTGVTFAFSLFGYIRLSEFILNRFILTVLILGIFYIVIKFISVLIHLLFQMSFWRRIFRISWRTLSKTEFWIGLCLQPIFFAAAVFVLLALWGVSVDLMMQKIRHFLTGFDVGGMRISIVSIVLGLITFAVIIGIFKWIRSSLTSGSLSQIDMEEGARSSLSAGLGFIGLVCAVLAAVAVMGGSFQGIAIVAGALSFGVGLGLQNIVSNFVSGIILIFERPIKIGDIIVVNGTEGIVRQINMRATKLETWNKSNIIIPNSDILSSSLINLTHDNRMARIDVGVGVAYDSDIALVKQVLLDIAASEEKVLKQPAPFISFGAFNDSSLSFQVSCFTADISNRLGISNNIREKIILEFRARKIEIPFPQSVVHLVPDSSDNGKV